ncbi:hypothetical protein CPB97_009312 [Podila verticillata]|nr:hypothetical protein CPB97_009312 [Podila verticillata]
MRPAVSVPHKEPRPERFDLGDGLVMRWSTKEDKDNIADCLADAFRWSMSPPDLWILRLCLKLLEPAPSTLAEALPFGYGYALPHKGGRPLKKLNDVLPALKPNKSELFTQRSATKDDIPYLTRLTRRLSSPGSHRYHTRPGPEHPVTTLLAPHLGAFSCFCLYTRIPSYPKFILKVAPELEARLAKSPLAGVSAVIHLDCYRRVEGASGRGLDIVIEQGRIDAWATDAVWESW